MDLRQLRYFVAVAEELHFTRAAARLHLAQSALSAQIVALEREIGAPLLTRSNRRVALTPVGAALLPQARELLADADRVLAEARAHAQREADTLAIGCLGAVPGELLSAVLRELGRERPAARAEVHAFDFAQIQDSLTEARADVAFLYLPYEEDKAGEVEVIPLVREPRVVLLPAAHPLAERERLTPADLAEETFISHSTAVPERWRDFWLLTDELGRRPRVHHHTADTLEEWLHLIAQGEGIDTAPTLISRYYPWPGIRFVPLADAAPATLAVVRRRSETAEPLVEAFVRLARDVSARELDDVRAP
jgi:LysR family transcriptional regulator, benzoate and cis,cis-muconate-responsive activator of ben and cat genes